MSNSLLKRRIIPFVFSKMTLSGLIIPYYHLFADTEILHTKHLYGHKTIRQFREDIDYLARRFSPIGISDLLGFLGGRHGLPTKSVLLTFDDGFRQMYDFVAPILTEKGIPAVFFVNSSFVDNQALSYEHKASLLVEHLMHSGISVGARKRIEEIFQSHNIQCLDTLSAALSIRYPQRHLIDDLAQITGIDWDNYLRATKPYLTREQITDMIDKGFAIGAHSIDHPLYADLPLSEQLRQTLESVAYVRKTFDLNYGLFAFPHSDTGVGNEYFNRIAESGQVDISFGTSGMLRDPIRQHFQRFSLERPLLPAEKIVPYQQARRLWYMLNGRGTIRRG